MTNSVRLVDFEDSTNTHIFAEINDKGDLIFSGHNCSQAPKDVWGHPDHAYWLTVKAADKDRVLLALIERLFVCDPLLISEVKDYLESKGIPCEFHSHG